MADISWKNHIVELMVVFIGITAAFGLNNWRDKMREASLKKDISNPLKQILKQTLHSWNP